MSLSTIAAYQARVYKRHPVSGVTVREWHTDVMCLGVPMVFLAVIGAPLWAVVLPVLANFVVWVAIQAEKALERASSLSRPVIKLLSIVYVLAWSVGMVLAIGPYGLAFIGTLVWAILVSSIFESKRFSS